MTAAVWSFRVAVPAIAVGLPRADQGAGWLAVAVVGLVALGIGCLLRLPHCV